jgi:hypothetical protein
VRPLAPSPAWTLVTPYCKRTRPGRGTNTKAAGFPPLSRPSPATSLPPFALAHALDPSGLGHAATFTRRLRDPPVSKRRQNSIALSTTKAEYIAAGHCCAQLLWMRQTLRDYGYKLSKVPLLCDNESAIRMADNPVEHSRTKHIDIRYHFLRDHQQRGISRLLMSAPKNN